MNKNIWMGIIVIVLLIVGWMAFSQKGVAPTTETSQTATNGDTSIPSTNPLTTKGTNTFLSIFNQQGSHTCTYEQVTPTTRSSNAIFIADGKMRGEFRSTTGDKTIGRLMVYNNGTLYTWDEGTAVGTTAQIKTVADLPSIIPKDLTSGEILGAGINNASWDCHDWSKDLTKLAPPATVKFK